MGLIYDLRIAVKLFLLIFTGLLGISIIVAINLMELNDQLYEDRKDKTKSVVEMGYSQLQHFAALAAKGEMSKEDAQEQAKKAVEILRYEGSNYLWINDNQPTMIMHPMKPALNGKDLGKIQDKKGKLLFVEFVRTVRSQNGAGFVEYYWPKPGLDEPVLKLSYVKELKSWGWIIGSGIYVDDVEGIFWGIALENLLIALVVSLVMIGFSIFVSNTIRSSIREFKTILTEIHVDGNLQKRLQVKGGDEIGAIAVMVNGLLDAFKKILEGVHDTSTQLGSVSGSMRDKSEEAAERVQQMHIETEQVATAITEMTAASQEVARNAANAAEHARSTNEHAEEGNQIVTASVGTITALAEEVQKAVEVIGKLSDDSNQIWSIVEVINNIADQTNLLALNAAIEAARAGDQGRGFAVVADEVRSLAQKTQDSTKEIQEMITNIQRRAEEAVTVMDEGRRKVDCSVSQAEETRAALTKINASIAVILDMNYQIATAAEEQTATTEEINRSILTIKGAAESNGQLAVEASGLSGDVDHLTKALQGTINKFRF